jgi:hypothetical protein
VEVDDPAAMAYFLGVSLESYPAGRSWLQVGPAMTVLLVAAAVVAAFMASRSARLSARRSGWLP